MIYYWQQFKWDKTLWKEWYDELAYITRVSYEGAMFLLHYVTL